MPDILLQDIFTEIRGIYLHLNKKRARSKANRKALKNRLTLILLKDRKEIDDSKIFYIDAKRSTSCQLIQ